MTTTSIRVSSETRDRLGELASEHGFTNVDRTIAFLLNEQWKAKCIEESDRFREQDPDGWREELEEATAWDVTLADGLEDEPPFQSDDPYWLAAGGAALTPGKDAARD
jgi:predicted transcriptional regulator